MVGSVPIPFVGRLAGQAPDETGSNPNKPKRVKSCGINRISLGAEEQTHLAYLALYQCDREEIRRFFEENGCGILPICSKTVDGRR